MPHASSIVGTDVPLKSKITCSRSGGGSSISAYAFAASTRRQHVADQRQGIHPPGGAERDHRLVQSLAAPSLPQRGRQRTDLGGDDRDAVVVELLAQGQRRGGALIEAGRDDRAADSGHADGLVQRRIGAGQFDHPVGPAPPVCSRTARARSPSVASSGVAPKVRASSSRRGTVSTANTWLP